MQVAAAPSDAVRAFVQEYFDAWRDGDTDRILDFFTSEAVCQLPTGTLEGKAAVRDNFVLPFVAAFPGNVHSIVNLVHSTDLVAVEWNFDAVHRGPFGALEPTGNPVHLPGCSFYGYDLASRKIHSGRLYFDFAALLGQLGVKA